VDEEYDGHGIGDERNHLPLRGVPVSSRTRQAGAGRITFAVTGLDEATTTA
jgi:hypothetical protein